MTDFSTEPEIDSVIRATRATTPKAAVEARKVPRASIGELNDLDLDTIKDRYLKHGFDDRSPLVKILDLVDLPRNVVANVLYRGSGAVDSEGLRKGAFGLPSVSTSDALGSLGVKSHLVRGIAGFVGDVALDPLTYLGPAGWGLEVTDNAGRATRIIKPGRKLIQGGIDAVKAGGKAAPEVQPLFDAVLANAGREFKDGADAADHLSKRLIGDVTTPKTMAGKGLDYLSRVTGGARKGEGSVLANSLGPEGFTLEGTAATEAQAARDFVAKYGKAAAPGYELGGRGSQIAHIPFTSYSLSTKPISRAGRAAAMDARHAASPAAGSIADTLKLAPEVIRGGVAAKHMEGIIDDIGDHLKQTNAITDDLDAKIGGVQQAKDSHVASALDPDTRPFDAELDALRARKQDHLDAASLALRGTTRDGGEDIAKDSLLGRLQGHMTELQSVIEQKGVGPATPQNVSDLMALDKLKQEAEASFNLLHDRAKQLPMRTKEGTRLPNLSDLPDAEAEIIADATQKTMSAYSIYHRSVDGAVKEFARLNPKDLEAVDNAARFLGTDERIIGRAALSGIGAMSRPVKALEGVFGTRGTVLDEGMRSLKHAVSPGARRVISTYGDGVFKDLKGAFEAAGITPTGKDFDEGLTMLEAYAHANANKAAQAAGGEAVYHTTEFGSDRPAGFLRLIEDAARSGKFSKESTGILNERLQAIAAKHGNDLVESLGKMEVADGILKPTDIREGYLPHSLTRQAQEIAGRAKEYGSAGATGKGATKPGSAFQKERSFDQVRWESPVTGAPKRLFRAEIDQAERSLADPSIVDGLRQSGRKEAADSLEQLAMDYGEFKGLKEPPPWRMTSSFEMNEQAAKRRFAIMMDGEDVPFMHTNFVSMMANRIGQHERVTARESWAKMTEPLGMSAPKEWRGVEQGGKIIMSDGSTGEKIYTRAANGEKIVGLKVGGQVYRPLRADIKHDVASPIIESFGQENLDRLYSPGIADRIERVADATSVEKAGPVLSAIDAVTRQWKSLTLLHPSWSIFNFIGDTLNGVSNGLNLAHYAKPENVKFAAKAILNAEDPEALRKLTMNINGQTMTGEMFWHHLMNEKVIDGTMMEESFLKMIEEGQVALSSSVAGRSGLDKFRPSVLKSDTVEAAQINALARKSDTVKPWDKARGAGAVLGDRYMQNVLGPWFRVNQKVQNFIRANMFLSFMHDGNDIKAAARKTVEANFDYADATTAERAVFKRVLPFYAWMRNNGAYQVQKLLEHPVYAASFPKVQAAIEEAIAGDSRVPLEMRPNWMRQQLATQIGSDPDFRFSVLFGGGLPAADVYNYLTPILGKEGIADFAHYVASGINPLAQLGLNTAYGKELFSGRSIGSDAYSGDVSMLENLKNQVRPLAELGPGGKVYKAFGNSVGEGVSRLALGGRVQDFSEERVTSSKTREYKEKETGIRQAISRAERNGDTETSLRGRIKLLELYSTMQANGHGGDIPKWAKPQLESLAAGSA